MTVTTSTVEEDDTTWLTGFDARSLPYKLGNRVRVITRGAATGIEASGVVGTVPLLNGDILRIRSKVGDYNFVRMLLTADGLYADLKPEFDELAMLGIGIDASPLWLVCRALVSSLNEISQNSLAFSRQKRVARGVFAAGRLHPVETALRQACYADNPLVFTRLEREYDTPEHRVLGKAAELAISFLERQSDAKHVGIADRWAKRFALFFELCDLEHVSRNLRVHRYGGSRGYYARALALARILLGDAGYSAEATDTEMNAEGFLVDSALLFERYNRAVLVRHYNGQGVIITQGGGVSSATLYLDGSFELEPDYVYWDGAVAKLIADAKYKQPSSSDHYQMLCYLMRYGVSTGLFIYPKFSSSNSEPVRRVTPDGLIVWELPLPLSDLNSTEKILSKTLERFAPR